MDDVRRINAVEDHVHDADDIGERLFFLAVEGFCLERGEGLGGQFSAGFDVLKRLAQEACRTDGPVVDGFADFGLDDLDNGPDEGARGVNTRRRCGRRCPCAGFCPRRGGLTRISPSGNGSEAGRCGQ